MICYEHIMRAASHYNLKCDGAGVYGRVKQRRNGTTIKISPDDGGYNAYVEYCLGHQNCPYVPKIYRTYEADGAMMVVMETLYQGRFDQDFVDTFINPNLYDDTDSYEDCFEEAFGMRDSWSPCGATYRKTFNKRFFNYMIKFLEYTEGLGFVNDMHCGNVMYRKHGCAVITDPWAGSGISFRDAIKAYESPEEY